MSMRAFFVCLLHCFLALLCIVPLVCAAEAGKILPETVPMGSAASCPPTDTLSGGTVGYTGTAYGGNAGIAYGGNAGTAYGGNVGTVYGGNAGFGSFPTSAPSIGDVWLQDGGARLYYSAQYRARQQYTGGATRIDPACLPLLPPMKAWRAPASKKAGTARKTAAAANPNSEIGKKSVNARLYLGAAQVDSKGTSQADSTSKATVNGKPASVTPLKAAPAADATKDGAGMAEKVPLH